jgi:hypothetical protein
MHIDSALKGVSEDERCPGWKTGQCTLNGEGACQHTCDKCGMCMQACTKDFLAEVMAAHTRKPFLGLKSQCDKKKAGLIRGG